MSDYANDFTDSLRTYYKDLKKRKPITREKERRLLLKCKKGNLKARNELLEANLRFVFDTAKKYSGHGVSMPDLVSEGNIGLMKAIEKFDIDRDVKFISYAVWWIRQAMIDAIKKSNKMTFVEIERGSNNDIYLEGSIYDEEDDIELVDESDSLTMCKTYTNEEDIQHREASEYHKSILGNAIRTLNNRERDIIENYYGINGHAEHTLASIGKKYHLSCERVRQIKLRAMSKLQASISYKENVEEIFA